MDFGYEEAADGIYVVDTGMFGVPEYTASFLIRDRGETALVDAGVSTDVDNVLGSLEELGVDDLDYHVVTHVHMDHAGGSKAVLEKYPDAEIICHPNAEEYLTDHEKVSRLVESVMEAVGPLADAYGEMEALPPGNVETVEDGETLEIGDKEIEFLHTEGHAPHHMSLYDPDTSALFVIDEGCTYISGEELPTTPPPDFDYEETLSSYERFKDLDPELLLYGHYGVNYDDDAVDRHEEGLKEWVEVIDEVFRRKESVEDTVDEVLKRYDQILVNPAMKQVARRDVKGVIRYLKNRS
ncbi:MAG: MBL fold metallo-hydrolase [Halobacteria archaeon]